MPRKVVCEVVITGPTEDDTEEAMAALIEAAINISNSTQANIIVMEPHVEQEVEDTE
jgi:hypothetical protein